ncbi:hypothetical protein Droror1_Dr00004123 [Drosera rotundifolia]
MISAISSFTFSPFANPNFSRINSSSKHRGKSTTARSSSSSSSATPAKLPAIRVAKRVVLVRHGQSTWNAEGRIQGSSDFSVLTDKGEAQALTSRQMLIEESFDVCFASPLSRALRTTEIIWGNREREMILDYDLREIDLYSFQGLLKHEGKEKFGDAYRQWQVDAPNFVIDDHYPVRELWARARSCWNRILAHDSKSVLVVAHNAVNQALIASSIGLGTGYFRRILQSNCGVSALDFIPRAADGSPHVCLNRLNQTQNLPIVTGSSGGRNTSQQIILVCRGSLNNVAEVNYPLLGDVPLSMLGVIQSQKAAELLLDVRVDTVVTTPRKAMTETADIISKLQGAADCLVADYVPRHVDIKHMDVLDVENIFMQINRSRIDVTTVYPTWLEGFGDEVLGALWDQSKKAWHSLLEELQSVSRPGRNVVVVCHPVVHIALIAHCLNLTKEWMSSFHLDDGSISVLDFPDGPSGKGAVRCTNYTAHLGRWSIPITKPTSDELEV